MFRDVVPQTHSDLTIRRLGPHDAQALTRLAQRDSAPVPFGTVYAASSAEGSLLAAISLENRALVADPFLPTEHAAKLLQVWAEQLTGDARPRRTRRRVTMANGVTARDLVGTSAP